MKRLLACHKLLFVRKPKHRVVLFGVNKETFRWIKISRAGDTLRAKGSTTALKIHTLDLRDDRLVIFAGVVEVREEQDGQKDV